MSSFDTLAVNPYARNQGDLLRYVRSVRKSMNRYRARRKKIWLTNLSWADAGSRTPFNVGPQGQAARIADSFTALWQNRKLLGIRGAVYSSWKDSAGANDRTAAAQTDWRLHTGLVDGANRPKPSLAAFGQTALALRP